jgi:cytoskeleton protein RodZ
MATFGDTLKRERELRKISLREVSEATKIGLRYLEALEGNRFEQLPGGVFNKGFIRAYAKFIGLDGEALINTYLYDVAHRKRPTGPAAEGTHHPALTIEELPLPNPPPKPGSKVPAAPMGKYVAMGTAALLMVAAGAWLLLARRPATAPAVAEPRNHTGATPQTAGLLRTPPKALEPGQASEANGSSAAPAAETAPTADPGGSAKDSKETHRRRSEHALGILVGTAEPTWISIRCGGVEKLKRDLIEGEMVAFSCASDLLLSTGNAGALSLWVEGRECLPLGERGASLQDFLLDSARVAEICPPEEKP